MPEQRENALFEYTAEGSSRIRSEIYLLDKGDYIEAGRHQQKEFLSLEVEGKKRETS